MVGVDDVGAAEVGSGVVMVEAERRIKTRKVRKTSDGDVRRASVHVGVILRCRRRDGG